MNVFDHIGRFYSADVRLADELTARTGDRLATHSGLVRCQSNFFFKIGSSFVQNMPHRRTFSHFGYLSSFFILTLPPRANAPALAALALRTIFKDTALCNKILKGFLSVTMWFVATPREPSKAKIVGAGLCRTGAPNQLFCLTSNFSQLRPQRRKEEASFSALCLCKRQTFHSLFIKPQS